MSEYKYGHNLSEDEIKLTLPRSSYDPLKDNLDFEVRRKP